MDENNETQSRWSIWVESFNTYVEHLIDVSLDHTGCALAAIIVSCVLVLMLALSLVVYDSYIHRNQHCVLAHREYVLINKVYTPVDVCDQWQNN